MKLQRRSAFGWGTTPAPSAPCKNGLVVHYDGSNTGLAGKAHSACVSYWKQTRSFHINGRGWLDIGYSFMVCPHGYVMEGRGWQRAQAAQPGGNTTWTSVTFASGPSERPNAAQVTAFKELRAWLRGKGLAAAISYHSRFVSTSCPGSILRGMVTSGALAGAAPKPPAKRTWWDVTYKGIALDVPWATPILRLGSAGSRVGSLQKCLNALLGADLAVDNDFGPATESAVKTLQRRYKDELGRALEVDGVYGHHSARALALALGVKKEDVV